VGETLGYFKIYGLPAGVSISALALVSSLLVFFVVSWLTGGSARASIDPDIQLVMDA
jgi:ABC-type sulfate transport system permease component